MSCHQEPPTTNGYPSKLTLLNTQESNGTSSVFTTEVSIELQQPQEKFQIEKLNGDFYLNNITEPKGHIQVDNEESKFINDDNLIHINTTEDENIPDNCDEESEEETFNSCMTTLSESLQEPQQSTYQNLLSIDDEEQVSERVRRCSSLKTGKTPPGTPKRKKIVRFADVFGLDLTDVKIFLDEIPRIPISAFNDLTASQATLEPEISNNMKSLPIVITLFQQPGAQPDFIERVRNDKVCLDSALGIDDPVKFTVKGVVRVRNLDFHKNVQIRYTTDSWQHFTEVEACYVQNSCDGFSDKFSFMVFTNRLEMWQTFQFAIRYRCGCGEFWDNNKGKNYSFQFVPSDFKDTTNQNDDNIVFY